MAPEKLYDPIDLNQAVKTLKSGGLILYPTDTIWGLGCDARNQQAVERIYDLKQRTDSKSMIILLDRFEDLFKYVDILPYQALEVADNGDRPTTVIYPRARRLAPNVIAGDGTVGIRLTKDPFCREIIRALGGPLVSTSANISGQAFGGSFEDVNPVIVKAVDYVVKWRQAEKVQSSPSRIVRILPGGKTEILRE